MDESGWVDVNDLLTKLQEQGHQVTLADIVSIVEDNDKKRFTLSADMSRIKAEQGHSISVELELEQVQPPEKLFHGTVDRFLELIKKDGLKKMNRHHVHLSKDAETAIMVGGRRGDPVILVVDAMQMHRDGMVFYRSANGVWLTDHVPPSYIAFP